MRKTKVICTLGPAVNSEEMIRKLVTAGMNAARFNFSHGTHESHLAQLNMLKHVRDEMCVPVATILDTKGPEIRVCLLYTSVRSVHRCFLYSVGLLWPVQRAKDPLQQIPAGIHQSKGQ